MGVLALGAGTGAVLVATAAPASASGTPSPTTSTVVADPNPADLYNGGSAAFTVTVTDEDADGNPISGDDVSLTLTGGPAMYCSWSAVGSGVSEEAAPTDSDGVVTFDVACPSEYSAGSTLDIGATDTTAGGVELGSVQETFVVVGLEDTTDDDGAQGTSGDTVELTLSDASPTTDVAVSFDGQSVTLSAVSGGACSTDDTGYAECTFTIPADTDVGSVGVVVSVGGEQFDVSFTLVAPPSITLSPASGLPGTTVTVSGSGFGPDLGEPGAAGLAVTFTPAGGTTATASTSCSTDGVGDIIDNTDTDTVCQLTVPAGTATGGATVAVTGVASATATFTVTATCAAEPDQAGCSITGLSVDTTSLPERGQDLYVGGTVTLPIDADYSDGSSGLLSVPQGESPPEVTLSGVAPSGAITYDGLDATNNGIELTASEPTTSPAEITVSYDDLTTQLSLGAENEPCGEGCFFVNGALVEVQVQVPGTLSSTPVSGATASIEQAATASGVNAYTVDEPCYPETSGTEEGCGPPPSGDPETASTTTCTTDDTGQCPLTAMWDGEEEGFADPDAITLFPPADYSVSGTSGCLSWAPLSSGEAVCDLAPADWSDPLTVTFDVEPDPTITVQVAGPCVGCGGINENQWANSWVNGGQVTFSQAGSTVLSCTLEGGADTDTVSVAGDPGGDQASCDVTLPAGEYTVTAGDAASPDYTIPLAGGSAGEVVYVTSTDPVTTTFDLDTTPTLSFSTATEPVLTVQVAGPCVGCGGINENQWANSWVNGGVATFTEDGTPVATCTIEGGTDTDTVSVGDAASPDYTIPLAGGSAGEVDYVTSTDPTSSTVGPGDAPTISFSTAAEPVLTVQVAGPCVSCGGLDENQWDNSVVDGEVATFTEDGTPVATCTLEGGTDADTVTVAGDPGGDQANCYVTLPVGTYDVSVPESTDEDGFVAYLEGADPVIETVGPGDTPTIGFSTTSQSLVDASSGSGSATTTDGQIDAVGSGGSGTVSVGEYTSDPEGAPSFMAGNDYFDVSVSAGSTLTSLTVTACGLQEGDYLYWWDPQAASGAGAWEDFSPAVAASGHCVEFTVSSSTSPTLAELTGTVFAAGTPEPTQTISFTSVNPTRAVVGTTYTPTATATSGLTVSFSVDPSSTAGACTLEDGKVRFTGPGTCVVDANQSGNSSWEKAPQVQQTITVVPRPPVAVARTYTTKIDHKLVVGAADGILAGDTLNGATISSHAEPAHGTLRLAANGSFTYVPRPSFWGTDSFRYTLTNAGGKSTATVTIDVGPAESRVVAHLSAPGSATRGSAITYRATVTNHGPAAAHRVDVVLSLPTQTDLVSVHPSASSARHGRVGWTLTGLGPGRTVAMTVVVQVKGGAGGRLAALLHAVPVGSADPDPAGETARADTVVGSAPRDRHA